MIQLNRRIGRARRSVKLAGLIAASFVMALLPMRASAADAQLPSRQLLASYQPGKVVWQAPLSLPAALAEVATAKRVYYISTDIAGKKIIVSGMIITPKTVSPNADIVAWGHGTTGLGDLCAPSLNQTYFWEEAVIAVKSYIDRGWVVAATDYPGKGTPGKHPYLIGDSEARAVIDSVRAAHDLGVDVSDRYVVSGHSQGGQAALFVSEIADTYGTGLALKGVVAMSPPSNAELIANGAAGTPANGYLVAALLGLAAVDSSVDPHAILAWSARLRLPVAQQGCYHELMGVYRDLTAQELLVGGVLPQTILDKLAQHGNPAQQAGTAPALLVQGTNDETVSADLTVLLQMQMCAYGTPVQLEFIEGANHVGTATQSTVLVADYISDRFNGIAAPSNCQ